MLAIKFIGKPHLFILLVLVGQTNWAHLNNNCRQHTKHRIIPKLIIAVTCSSSWHSPVLWMGAPNIRWSVEKRDLKEAKQKDRNIPPIGRQGAEAISVGLKKG
jgi:hypothetical protein